MSILTSATTRIVLIVINAIVLGQIFTPAVFAGPQSQPATRSTTQPSSDGLAAEQIARTILRDLETFLIQEHTNPRQAEQTLRSISMHGSNQSLTAMLSPYGLKPSDIPGEKLNLLRKEIAGIWAAVINFYAGYINYAEPKFRTFANAASSIPQTIQVAFPASRPDFPHPIKILVILVKENDAWKIRYLSLLPAQPAKK
ncbi:MAG: hypothetical protein WC975_00015 [Phycisphaerae bacterium]